MIHSKVWILKHLQKIIDSEVSAIWLQREIVKDIYELLTEPYQGLEEEQEEPDEVRED